MISETSRLIEAADDLTEIKAEIEALMDRATRTLGAVSSVDGARMIRERAMTYWVNHIENTLDGRACMVSMTDTIDELIGMADGGE